MTNIAIVGATGAVGKELLYLLEARSFPLSSLRCFASEKSAGTKLFFRGEPILVEPLTESSFENIDIAFFAASVEIAQKFAPIAVSKGALVIDKSSAFRMAPNVPLVIPEVNPETLATHQGIIASPNCTTIIMLMAVAPLHKKYPIQRIVAATYQAASGAGAEGIQELLEESRCFLENKPYQRSVFPQQYAFNIFPHNSSLGTNGYVDEEIKLLEESRKILNDPNIRITVTCVRVPTLRSHAEALNLEFREPVSVQEAYAILEKAPGLKIHEDRSRNLFPTPLDASEKNEVLCGRIRKDISHPNGLELWVVGDQLLKGAALNAIQIAEMIQANNQVSILRKS